MGPIHGWESSFFHSYRFFAVSISEFTDGVIANLGGLVYGICFVFLGGILISFFLFWIGIGVSAFFFFSLFFLFRPLGFAHDFTYSGLRLQLAFVIRYQLALALVISIIRRRPVHFAI